MNAILILVYYYCQSWLIFFVVMKALELAGWLDGLFQRHDVVIRLGYAQYYTDRLNAHVQRLSQRLERVLPLFYTVGMLFGLLAMLSAVLILIFNLYRTITAPTAQQVLTAVVPGMNVPLWHGLHYFIAIFVSGLFHEYGHALCASTERLPVHGMGIFLMFVYPGAFVSIDDHMQTIDPKRQLKIICAGAWHNFILSTVAYSLLLLLPLLLTPLYANPAAAVVSFVPEESILLNHVQQGDEITAINDCPVIDTMSFRSCFVSVYTNHQPGVCTSASRIEQAKKENGFQCCEPISLNPSALQCFLDMSLSRVCLQATQDARGDLCSIDAECEEDQRCIRPTLEADERFVRISLERKGERLDDVLFIGPPGALWSAFDTVNRQPRFRLWGWSSLAYSLPSELAILLHYFFSLSGALALLNMAPVFRMDGYHALVAALRLFFPTLPEQVHKRLCSGIVYVCTFLVLANTITAMLLIAQ
eukprot:CAMPEP_0177646382 /NCGR_PEP_ID=MMETSP0447-20121125/9745_1 /TAXON_ID=0 /ORGANISM="Stygamoeba regulata, Strain BSH-02190019" /LENGTH=474 /DNA_ID=CAMNT_0019148913 /DNA_START=154 /DNA_END=1578 /DNA_ORIENTATION=-